MSVDTTATMARLLYPSLVFLAVHLTLIAVVVIIFDAN
jgi:hypothetical protein